ncbi:MAG: hypothetical protein Q4E45_02375 [Eubacteriales bacterium]|nr:hypothetical protein [Eubacteriales bacterium]
MSDETKARPKLGTTEAAVRSCVSLMAAVVGQNEDLLAYWLDLYYFVRRAYEQENGDEAPVIIRGEDLLPALRRIWEEAMATPKPTAEGGRKHGRKQEAPAPAAEAEGTAPETAEAGEENGAERSAPPGSRRVS